MACTAVFHTLQSHSTTRTRSRNVQTFLLYTIVFLRLSAVGFVCEGSRSDLAHMRGLLQWTFTCWQAAEGANGKSDIHTHLFCVEEKGPFKFHWRFIKCNATCHILFLIKRLQCLHQKYLQGSFFFFIKPRLEKLVYWWIKDKILKLDIYTWNKGLYHSVIVLFGMCLKGRTQKKKNLWLESDQLVSSQCRFSSSPTGLSTMHGRTGPLVLVCLPLPLHPLHLLASFHGNNRGRERG